MPDVSMRDLVATELMHNDQCGPGPVSWREYRDDAEAILRIVCGRIREMAQGKDYATLCSWLALADELVIATLVPESPEERHHRQLHDGELNQMPPEHE